MIVRAPSTTPYLQPKLTFKKQNLSFFKLTRTAGALLLMASITFAGCEKDVTNSGAFDNVPRKDVPEPFVGTFTYVTSTGGYVDEYGHYMPGVAHGVTLTINRNGTGTSLYRVETGSYSGTVTTDEIRSKCTYEISKTDGNRANIVIHFVSGKNYHNGALLHDLDVSKLYPNGDVVWNDAEYGTNSEGKTIFIVGTGNNTSQFTKQ